MLAAKVTRARAVAALKKTSGHVRRAIWLAANEQARRDQPPFTSFTA
jgi:hypothetical protein